MLQKITLRVISCPPQHEVIIAFVILSKQMVKSEDTELVQKFVRTYFRAYKDMEKAGFKTDAQKFEQMFDVFDQFLTEYPKRHPVFKEPQKIDIIRLHVTTVKKIVKSNPIVVANTIGWKNAMSPLSDMIRGDLKKVTETSEEKENEESSALRAELARLVNRAANKETTKGGLYGIYEFKKKNPSFDINVVLATHSEYFRRYVEKNLEIYAKKDAGKFIMRFGRNRRSTYVNRHLVTTAAIFCWIIPCEIIQ